MSRLVFIALGSILLVTTACAPDSANGGADDPVGTAPTDAVVGAGGTSARTPPPPPADDDPRPYVADPEVRNVMYGKLAHAHALLDAITLADFARIEQNARELAWLSQLAEWQVHDTADYVRFSEQFRGIMVTMAEQAQAQNIFAVRQAHVEMTASCTECHAYLRREGLVPELPGAVSRIQIPHAYETSSE